MNGRDRRHEAFFDCFLGHFFKSDDRSLIDLDLIDGSILFADPQLRPRGSIRERG